MIEKAVILSTGDELTSGLTVDTNSNFLADKLFECGIDLVAVLTVGDDAERIRWAFASGLDRADLVIATGGLGPTADDLTTETLAATLGRKLHFDEESAEHIRALFRSIGRTMPENNLRQAMFPEGAVILANPLGTAPGYRVEVEWKGRTRFVVVMPGVPREMKPMMDGTVLPWMRSLDETGLVYRSRSFQTFGASESALDEMMKGAVSPEEGRLSFRAAFPQISVRVTAHGSPDDVDEKLVHLGERVRARIGDYVFGEGSATMEGVVEDLLRVRGWRLATAESVTGGLISERLTNVPGSSQVFAGGVVSYTLETKQAVLGVGRETLERHGAVSDATAKEMAAGARRVCGADLAVSVTGVAGPDGGTPEAPVGTVYVGFAADEILVSRRYQLWGTRDWIRLLASQIALDWVRRHALGRRPEESLLIRR
ncbi:MAG TPA: competence/damage-inducible protein A [Candidatus Binatia bacterium]|nr:competence/damage-inducible protein A [Candidatus Binatia bacterium]